MDQSPAPLLATHQLGGLLDATRMLPDLLEAETGEASMVRSLPIVRTNLNDNYCSNVSPSPSLVKKLSLNSIYNKDCVYCSKCKFFCKQFDMASTKERDKSSYRSEKYYNNR